MSKISICAMVVTYNRKILLLECLDALKAQSLPLDAIFIIDNASTDGTGDFLKENGYIKELPPEKLDSSFEIENEIKDITGVKYIKIYYVRMDKNTGGAGGFYEGVKRAYEKGYDWLWLMDDDAEPDKDALKNAFKYFFYPDVVGVANLLIGNDNKPQLVHRGYFKPSSIFPKVIKKLKISALSKDYCYIDHCSFAGFFISRKAIEKIGFPKKELFIHYDDFEYSLRIRGVGKIILVRGSIMKHKDKAKENLISKNNFGIERKITPFNSLWIKYYGIRNLFWLKYNYALRLNFFLFLLIYLVRKFVVILLFDDHKIKRFKFIINAIIDGINGNFDNDKPKRILYISN